MLKRRRWNEFRAALGGRFWLPCPVCGQMFGGHEKGGGSLLKGSRAEFWAEVKEHGSAMRCGRTTCPDCPGQHYEDDLRAI
jgi:hypothetical protein